MSNLTARGVEGIELELLLEGIAERYGYDFRGYSRPSLRRRVNRIVQSENVRTISALQDRILRDPLCMTRFVANLSVHVTAMFRDPGFYVSLRENVLPRLRTYPFVRIWHAGCSTGEEVYSLAIVLHEEGLLPRCRIYATDISEDLLKRAQSRLFPLDQMQRYTRNYLLAGGKRDFSSYYVADERNALFRRSIVENVTFFQHNLVADGQFNEFNLILCRNVMIYFDRELREQTHLLLYNSLMRWGMLGLGEKETLDFTGVRDRYEAFDSNTRLYRRIV